MNRMRIMNQFWLYRQGPAYIFITILLLLLHRQERLCHQCGRRLIDGGGGIWGRIAIMGELAASSALMFSLVCQPYQGD